MMKENHKYKLYWEDIGERIIYAELDDYAWKLAEKIYGYRKRNSIYIYHDGKLAAYYSIQDIKKEAELGYNFFSKKSNFYKIINLKKKALEKVQNFQKRVVKTKINTLADEDLRKKLLEALDIFRDALSVHYLTQPQFFEKFKKEDIVIYKKFLDKVAGARLRYTRIAWTRAMTLCKIFLKEYGKRQNLTLEETESFLYEEIKNRQPAKEEFKNRAEKFVIISRLHKIKLFFGSKVNKFIKSYESYKDITIVGGIVGNKGVKKGKAFVVKNEYLDLADLPRGMKEGMILIIQNAWPELSRYYKRASAIVTNEGGITSHGVVVAREFKIPCIVGTKIATKVFQTGDLVKVDANKGIVRKLK